MYAAYRNPPKRCQQQPGDRPKNIRNTHGRFKRYVDTEHFFNSKTLNDLRPFYNGTTLDNRMGEIRKSIYYIRQNWGDFDKFLQTLKEFLEKDDGLKFEDEAMKADSEKLLLVRRDWLSEEDVKAIETLTYDAIKVYTSHEGYSKMYKLSNNIFRQADSVEVVEMIRNVTFLVELINIDLFNYCIKNPELNNFEGKVYRGMLVSDADLEAFNSLRKEMMNRRNIAVPLGLFSGSSSLDEAKNFLEEKQDESTDDKYRNPLLMVINVIGLKPEYVEHYTKRFPTSVLSTICAVDIHKLSTYPEEREVLLRGPFLTVLHVYKDECELLDQSCDVLELVMLNANRDHISTSQLGDQDDLARGLFGTMVGVTRSEFAVEYYKGKELHADAEEHQQLLDDNLVKLEGLMTL